MQNNLGIKIAEGGCSEVFEWGDDDKIIKLAKANTDIYAMRREYNSNRIAWDIGLPVAQPYEMLDVDGRPGIVFERIVGESLLEQFMKLIIQNINTSGDSIVQNNENSALRTTAQILSQIHNYSDLPLSSQRENMKYCINEAKYLTPEEKVAVIHILDNLPLKLQLCHGDPNPNNILIRDGKAVIIDWMDASIGNPEADLAEYIVMIRFVALPADLPRQVTDYFDSIREQIISTFIDEYMQLASVTPEAIDSWILPVAARKLNADAIPEVEKERLVNEIRRRLSIT